MQNKFAYCLVLFFLIVGILTYDFVQIRTGFSYTDELIAMFLFLYWCFKEKHKTNGLLVVFTIFCIYLFNSIIHPHNVLPAILGDFIQQLKPFLAFYTMYDLGMNLNSYYRRKICKACLWLTLIILPIGIIGIGGRPPMNEFGGHSRYATSSICLGCTYFFFSQHKKKDLIKMFLIFSVGLLSLRSKMFGFYAAAFAIFILWKNVKMNKKLLNVKTLMMIVVLVPLVIWAAWEKINFYFIEGFEATNMFARPLLYVKAIEILNDFPLLGTGFGSYATDASAVYYSPLYFTYELYLSPEIGEGLFLSDTYFPVLAQFGYIGVALFFYFWYSIIKKSKKHFDVDGEVWRFKMTILIVVFFFIESIADSTFTQNRGLYMMAMLGLCARKNIRQ